MLLPATDTTNLPRYHVPFTFTAARLSSSDETAGSIYATRPIFLPLIATCPPDSETVTDTGFFSSLRYVCASSKTRIPAGLLKGKAPAREPIRTRTAGPNSRGTVAGASLSRLDSLAVSFFVTAAGLLSVFLSADDITVLFVTFSLDEDTVLPSFVTEITAACAGPIAIVLSIQPTRSPAIRCLPVIVPPCGDLRFPNDHTPPA